jgi:hypothetical protein
MNIAPLLCVVRVTKMPLLFLTRGLLLAVFTVFTVSATLAISSVSHVDFPVVLLLLRGPLATRFKKSSLGFESLNAYVNDCEHIDHHFGLLHGDLLHNLDAANSVVEGFGDFDVLDIQDSVSDVAEMFQVVPEALIILMLDGLQSLNSR